MPVKENVQNWQQWTGPAHGEALGCDASLSSQAQSRARQIQSQSSSLSVIGLESGQESEQQHWISVE